jgi:N-acetylglucosaminyldiphosphoundecaprenol N-acetyl-beta-D-mannosaminyltransferase
MLKIFDIKVFSSDRNALMKKIDNSIEKMNKQMLIGMNTNSVYFFRKNHEYYEIMKKANTVYADGMSIVWGGRILGIPIVERLVTTDIIIYLLEHISKYNKDYKIFFLGGEENIVKNAADNLSKKYPKAKIVGYYSPKYMTLEEMEKTENYKICKMINEAEVNILFVGFGTPKQEIWCNQNIDRLNVQLIMPCGGLYGYYGGEYKRAPVWMQNIGMEWVFRTIQEPSRLWKRYVICNSIFIIEMIKEIASNCIKWKKS